MAKPHIIENLTKKYSEPRIFSHPVSNIKNNIVKDLIRPSVLFYGRIDPLPESDLGSSRAIDERDMRYWKEFDNYPGKLIGVMRRWENGNR